MNCEYIAGVGGEVGGTEIYSKLYFFVKNNYENLVLKKYDNIDIFFQEHSRLFYSQIFDINTIPLYYKSIE